MANGSKHGSVYSSHPSHFGWQLYTINILIINHPIITIYCNILYCIMIYNSVLKYHIYYFDPSLGIHGTIGRPPSLGFPNSNHLTGNRLSWGILWRLDGLGPLEADPRLKYWGKIGNHPNLTDCDHLILFTQPAILANRYHSREHFGDQNLTLPNSIYSIL